MIPKPFTILISAGGTGGGVYPALAVAEGLRRIAPDCILHYAGSVGGMERDLVAQEPQGAFAGYHEVQSGPMNGVPPQRVAASLIKLLIGLVQSLRLITQIHPDALFLTGGWVTFPVAIACWLRRVPMAIFLPDIEPALAIKVLSRLARVVMTTTADSVGYFRPGTTVRETGYPLRQELMSATREAGIKHFSLARDRKTLLVFGGSRGARSINEALLPIVPDLVADGLQIIHVTGELDWPTVQAKREKLSSSDKDCYQSYAYLHHEMGLAMAAADLAVCRAGASVLGEFPYFGLPSILIPLAFAWRYQRINADWLASHGAAIRLDDAQMPANLLPTIRELIHDPGRLAMLQKSASALARQNAALEIAKSVIQLAKN